MEINEAANGPGRKELTTEEIIKEQQQRFKEVKEEKEALNADFETLKNAQHFHPEKGEKIRQSQVLAGRRRRTFLKKHLYSGIHLRFP